MIFVRPPTAEELVELKHMTRHEIGRVSQRAQMIMLSSQRRAVPAIAELFETNRKTVRFWIKQFDQQGPAGLYDQPRSGRPRKVSPPVSETIQQLVCADPQATGQVATFWTVAMLILAVVNRLNVHLSATTMRAVLHGLGLRWSRPRLCMPKKLDPAKALKQWAIAQAVIAAGAEAVVLYADESRIQLLPLIRALWHQAGQQLRIPTPGTNATRAIFGALNIRTGQWSYLIRERMRAQDFIAFLEHLLQVFPNQPILLIVDNYGNHTAKLVKTWLAEHPQVQLHFLPKYCSHLNPVELIWLRMKNAIAANRLYASMQLLIDSVNAFFAVLSPDLALRWTAA
jgi:transposase